jgi:2-keto-4-pentenoate hydratase
VGVDPRLVAALEEQLRRRRVLLDRGARHVGWKLGMGNRERIGGNIAVGHLTSATVVPTGAHVRLADGKLRADAEAFVELGAPIVGGSDADPVTAAIRGYGPALEVVDLAPLPGEPGSIVATNVFHRAVAFGDLRHAAPDGVEAVILVNGKLRDSAAAPDDLPERIARAAAVLAAVGDAFEAGDRIITGSVVQVPFELGDEIVADFRSFGSVRLDVVEECATVPDAGP